MNRIRKLPPICFGNSLVRLITRRLRYSKQFIGSTVYIEDGRRFTIFRHIKDVKATTGLAGIFFIVCFKFSTLSHRANKIVSKLPMLLITGYPGFQEKMYGVDEKGFWMGLYQWESESHLTAYKKSFVFRMMNKRAVPGSISLFEFPGNGLAEFVKRNSQNG